MLKNMQEVADVRRALLRILEKGPQWADLGVCYNLGRYTELVDGYAFVTAYAHDWPYAVRLEDGALGDWFIPDGFGSKRTVKKWEGKAGALRRDLVRHLLGKVAEEEARIKPRNAAVLAADYE